MSGLYLHIPFCKQACHYCNFHFSTNLGKKEAMVNAIAREIQLRADYLVNKELTSIYFGGGTPSLLNATDLALLFEAINAVFTVPNNIEITLEANPDDLTAEQLQVLTESPVNRLSIGVQSFAEEDLKQMNRAHNVREAHQCIEMALALGFDLSIDLIYGSPTTTDDIWQKNMQTVFDYGIPHLSCYALTVEPKTALHHFVKKGKMPAPNEEQAARQFEQLIDAAISNGFEHYEISNFAKPGHIAQHNSSYWKGTPYLGVGPAAHSFNKNSRQWNVANNALYLKTIEQGSEEWKNFLFEKENLSLSDQYNEQVMTSLRTHWGLDPQDINPKFRAHFISTIQYFVNKKYVLIDKNSYKLTKSGKLIADYLASELFH